jgi:hypothetical protein
MSKLSVFVSSTCYDLKSLREHLAQGIKELGHEPVMSELTGFPVDPNSDTVTTCKLAVREKADVFVLIIGGRYGYTVPAANKSVTNLEYGEAKRKGVDVYVFVDAKVWEAISMYRDNPGGNFASVVDNVKIFQFIEELKAAGGWIYRFSRTEEILDTLSIQMSIRYRRLLGFARENRMPIPTIFNGAPSRAIDIYIHREPFWEFELTHVLLGECLRFVEQRMSDLDKGLYVKRNTRLSPAESFDFLQMALADVQQAVEAMKKAIGEIYEGWGPAGFPGDPLIIKKGCDDLYRVALGLLEWEADFRFTRPTDEFLEIFRMMSGWTENFWEQIQMANQKIGEVVQQKPTGGSIEINMTLSSPRNIDAICEAIEQLKHNADLMARIGSNSRL